MKRGASGPGAGPGGEVARGGGMTRWVPALALFAAAGALAFAAVSGPAEPVTLQDRVQEVAGGLRCPVCQSLSVADSSSQVAREMREQIARDLLAGKSADEIRAEFAAAYGEWVLEAPEKRGIGLVAWLLPVGLLGAGALVSGFALRRWSRRRDEVGPLEEADRELLHRALADPGEEAVRALGELDEELQAGELAPAEHAALRGEAEHRAVAVLRHAGREGAPPAPAGAGELRPRRGVLPVALAAAAATVLGATLSASLRDRAPDETITGADVGGESAIEIFERRVREHPDDLAARLDLADRYLAAGDAAGAIEQYRAALELDPGNPEALSRLGFLLFRAGRPEAGLAAVDEALQSMPDYPEALYFRGAILIHGLDRRAEGAQALRTYLEVAPFGGYREQARSLLAEVEP